MADMTDFDEFLRCDVSILKGDHYEGMQNQFLNKLLSQFRQDAIGKVCTTDEVLLKIGRALYNKVKSKEDKAAEVRKSVITEMRRLASLYLSMKRVEDTFIGKCLTLTEISLIFSNKVISTTWRKQ